MDTGSEVATLLAIAIGSMIGGMPTTPNHKARRGMCAAVLFCALTLCLFGCRVSSSDPPALGPGGRVLIFTKTTGFRHASIPDGVQALTTIAKDLGFEVEATEDASVFNPAELEPLRVVVFLNTTGDVLDDGQQIAFQEYIRGGGGFVGVHSASDTEHGWSWYGELVGAVFQDHPAIQEATLRVEAAAHPSTDNLPANWVRTDEWYNFAALPAPTTTVLLSLDETTYQGGTMGTNHPMTWFHSFEGGRAWYTALGHTEASYREPLFLDHLEGGLLWAAGRATLARSSEGWWIRNARVLDAEGRFAPAAILVDESGPTLVPAGSDLDSRASIDVDGRLVVAGTVLRQGEWRSIRLYSDDWSAEAAVPDLIVLEDLRPDQLLDGSTLVVHEEQIAFIVIGSQRLLHE